MPQLSQLAANAATDGDMAEEGAGAEAQEAQQAADLAFSILLEAGTDPRHGLCEGGGGGVTLAAALAAQLAPGKAGRVCSSCMADNACKWQLMLAWQLILAWVGQQLGKRSQLLLHFAEGDH